MKKKRLLLAAALIVAMTGSSRLSAKTGPNGTDPRPFYVMARSTAPFKGDTTQRSRVTDNAYLIYLKSGDHPAGPTQRCRAGWTNGRLTAPVRALALFRSGRRMRLLSCHDASTLGAIFGGRMNNRTA